MQKTPAMQVCSTDLVRYANQKRGQVPPSGGQKMSKNVSFTLYKKSTFSQGGGGLGRKVNKGRFLFESIISVVQNVVLDENDISSNLIFLSYFESKK